MIIRFIYSNKLHIVKAIENKYIAGYYLQKNQYYQFYNGH